MGLKNLDQIYVFAIGNMGFGNFVLWNIPCAMGKIWCIQSMLGCAMDDLLDFSDLVKIANE
ncbi:hypothetical protein TI04_11165 [Achromatium sp. WMS2]|nr:hypothetical protein TI04_11165 [Achromatium sp. WMS2]